VARDTRALPLVDRSAGIRSQRLQLQKIDYPGKGSGVHAMLLSRTDIKELVKTIVTGRNVFNPGIREREFSGGPGIKSKEHSVYAGRGPITSTLVPDVGLNLVEKPLLEMEIVLDLSPLLRGSLGRQIPGTTVCGVPCSRPGARLHGLPSACRRSGARCGPRSARW
jgi:hypothetical protein